MCGGELVERRATGDARATALQVPAAAADTLDDLAAAVWVQAYDAAWLGQRWSDLERLLAADVAVLDCASGTAISGRPAVLEHLRATLRGAEVHEYNATDLITHSAGAIGVITYRWQLDWTVERGRRALRGRDVLVLRAGRTGWQLAWRGQLRS